MIIKRIDAEHIQIEDNEGYVEFPELYWPEEEAIHLYSNSEVDIIHQLYKASALFIIDKAGKEKHEME